MTVWICPECGRDAMMLDENDKRIVCWADDCNFCLEIKEA